MSATSVKALLTPAIQQELEKYAQEGRKVKLKTARKKRIKYTAICGPIALLGFAHPVFFAILPLYGALMHHVQNPVNVIVALAQKQPDKPMREIIAEEMVSR